ncbi:ABC transporter ATP-binding protein [Pelagimonas varians]|uniref:Putative siderophore transport system ATP-binding protein YusV n=1 Tax=Pelagimonas varians TaxID=696760 RepID=A0A238KFJ6_9RHOB|nr:ATP-binding cassette domain-containing protein [Pelagimonas varians]PYG32456.1 iron complex transport system ATP-binding protein [Pelagimonas varians]SMX41274.1 putative siderophore transport system ATP-binding protein YusV [Pelagimonas varians]
MIRVSGLSYHYGAVPILHDLTLDIPRGGVTALVGPNGAGKSTLLGLIARLMSMQAGRILVDDLDVANTPGDVLARKLAILPQASEVAPRLSVSELVSFGRYPHHKGRPSADDRRKVQEALAAFDLTAMAERSLDSLSGGQRQRAHVAMTFAQDTEYVLLDEPLNNLDIAASRSLMKLLCGVAHDHGRTVVTVLHDINYASAYADHIVTLKGGRLGPSGAPADVVSNDMLKSVFGTDAHVVQSGGRTLVQV